jgi:enterochelin esterase-like enzyme
MSSPLQAILGLFLIALSAALLALVAIVLLLLAKPEPVPATAIPTSTPTSRATSGRQTPVATPGVKPVRCQETIGQVADETYFSDVSGTKQTYIVYVPPCYDVTPTRYPTIYLIHGAGVDDTHWESLGVFKAMDEGIQAGKLAPAIIVLPSGDADLFMNTSGDSGSYEAQIADELIPTVDNLFRTDPRPEMRAIGGISRGGVWSLEIGFRHPGLFNIVGGHSPCLNLNGAPPEFDPLKMTDKPTLKTQRIFLDAGDRDECKIGADEQHLALENSGVAHVYKIWPGGHENALWEAHLGDYLDFYTQTWPKQQ